MVQSNGLYNGNQTNYWSPLALIVANPLCKSILRTLKGLTKAQNYTHCSDLLPHTQSEKTWFACLCCVSLRKLIQLWKLGEGERGKDFQNGTSISCAFENIPDKLLKFYRISRIIALNFKNSCKKWNSVGFLKLFSFN